MKNYLAILFFWLFSSLAYGQQICSGTSIHIRLSSLEPVIDSLTIHTQIKAADGGMIAIGNFKATLGNGLGFIMRYNKDGSFSWVKKIASTPFSGYPAFESVQEGSNGNIFITAAINQEFPYIILTLSPTGNIINQSRINFINIPNLNNRAVNAPQIVRYGSDSLVFVFWAHYQSPDGTKVCLVTTDNNGNIGSSAILTSPVFPIMHIPYFRYAKINNSNLFLYGTSAFSGQCEVNTSWEPAFFFMEVDLSTKTITKKRAYCAPPRSFDFGRYEAPGDYFSVDYRDNVFEQENGNINMTLSHLGIESNPSDTNNILFSISTFDADFNHLKSNYITTGNFFRDGTTQELVITGMGARHFSFYDFKTQSIYYSVADINNNFLLQKKLSLSSSRKYKFQTRNTIIDPSYITNFDIISYRNTGFQIDKFKILDKDVSDPCFGTDTSFLLSRPALVSPINWQGQFTSIPGIIEIQPSYFFTSDFPIGIDTICFIQHICDTIKIHAPDTVCDISQLVSITAYKNPLCNRKVNFIFDTTQVQSYLQINDTTLQLTFNKSYRGKIIARPSSCDQLQDSTEIIINAPSLPVNLGKDTTYCPGRTYLLSAYNPTFKTYRWQNGSTDSIYVVSQPGTYYVSATDLCGRIYSDTIQIKNNNILLSAGIDTSVCKFQSISLQASPGFNNYTWSPSYRISTTSGKSVDVYPDVTTAYSVSADLFPGCSLKDTVLVSVKECGQYFFVPNAFTPNKDGKNDNFKPIISGALKSYQFTIYNRWGQRVFLSDDRNKGWDGTIKGLNQDGNIFVWICKYQFYNQQPETKKGTVILLR